MKKPIKYKGKVLTISAFFTILSNSATAQPKTTVIDSLSTPYTKTVIAGQYENTPRHNRWYGKLYRNDWNTPVRVKTLKLDTVDGGLYPYRAGGGRQTMSLHLRTKDNKEYILRSLDKSFDRALPETMQGTFIEGIIDDQVPIAEPYAAITIAPMAQAAGILHTNPIIRYVPRQPLLDSFNDDFGDRLYLLEQRPDGNWAEAANFSNSKNIISTEELLQKLQQSSTNVIDQPLYIRSRLFDMFIGDWGRHEDQWRWAEHQDGALTVYKPIPRDRDQAYTRFQGIIPKLALHAANVDNLQSFDDNIKTLKQYNYAARFLDRRVANETTLGQWVSIAQDMQQKLTDNVIENAIHQLPPEVFSLSGPDLISKLKARRSNLVSIAEGYYKFLARHVDVVGSEENELFEISRDNNEQTTVNVYNQSTGTPVYHRIFNNEITKDIRLYGISGNDKFRVTGDVDKGLKVRIIGGPDADSIIDESSVARGRRTYVYDDQANLIETGDEAKLHLSSDSAIHVYDYTEFGPHKKGIQVAISYNNPDRFYIGLGYRFARHYWRKHPYSWDQGIYLRYSLSQNAFSLWYNATFYQALGKWDVRVNASQDGVRWTYFYGLGNETQRTTTNRRYYQLRTDEFYTGVGINRTFRGRHNVDLTAFYSGIEIIEDPNRYVSENYTPNQLFFYKHHQYLGARLGYTYQHVNDPVVPTKGIMFYAGASYAENILVQGKGFATYNSILQLYVPLVNKFSLSLRGGLISVDGEPEFYQYASIGGSQTLRGFRRDRFWGKTAFYNSNELRWITDINSYYLKGKIGFLGFVDDGRVWMPNENSNVLHVGYGAGLIVVPFRLAFISLSYGMSSDGGTVHLRLNRVL